MNLAQVGGAGPAVLQLALALIGGGAISALVSGFLARRKTRAEADRTGADTAQALSAASVALLEPMREQITTLAGQVTSSRTEATELRSGLIRTRAELDRTRHDLDSARSELGEFRALIEEMTKQLGYYHDRYGPPSDGHGFRPIPDWNGTP